jgi:hypothetical protein
MNFTGAHVTTGDGDYPKVDVYVRDGTVTLSYPNRTPIVRSGVTSEARLGGRRWKLTFDDGTEWIVTRRSCNCG